MANNDKRRVKKSLDKTFYTELLNKKLSGIPLNIKEFTYDMFGKLHDENIPIRMVAELCDTTPSQVSYYRARKGFHVVSYKMGPMHPVSEEELKEMLEEREKNARKMDRYEFANIVIGEGSDRMLRKIFCDNERYENLVRQNTEEFEDVLVKKLSKMTVQELTDLAREYGWNFTVLDLE